MRRLAPWALLVAVVVGLLACSLPPPLGPPPAQVVVELTAGFAQPPAEEAPGPERVELLLDVTESMRDRMRSGPRRYTAAREAAARLVSDLLGVDLDSVGPVAGHLDSFVSVGLPASLHRVATNRDPLAGRP